jgi:hypothetical protein
MYPATPEKSKQLENCPSTFFDFDQDGKVGLLDKICSLVGVIHACAIIANIALWMNGFMNSVEISDFVAANTRLIVLLLTKSYLVFDRDPTKTTWWQFFVDVNHDGVVQLIDVLAVFFNIVYSLSVSFSLIDLIFRPLGSSNPFALIQLTSQLNLVLISAFAAVHLSKGRISQAKRRFITLFSITFIILLTRTLLEMYWVPDIFKAVVRLANGLVLGVTQLVLGTFLVQNKFKEE